MFDIGAGQHIASGRMIFTADAEEITEYIRLVEMWPYTEKSMAKLKSNHPFFQTLILKFYLEPVQPFHR